MRNSFFDFLFLFLERDLARGLARLENLENLCFYLLCGIKIIFIAVGTQ
jgi:hypothetical protein